MARAFPNGLGPLKALQCCSFSQALRIPPCELAHDQTTFIHKRAGELLEQNLRYASLVVVQRPWSGQRCVGNVECNTKRVRSLDVKILRKEIVIWECFMGHLYLV